MDVIDHIGRIVFDYSYFISIPFAFWSANTDVARNSQFYKNQKLETKPIPWFNWSEFREYTSAFSLMVALCLSVMPWMNFLYVFWLFGSLIWCFILKPIGKGIRYLFSLPLSEIRPFAKK